MSVVAAPLAAITALFRYLFVGFSKGQNIQFIHSEYKNVYILNSKRGKQTNRDEFPEMTG